VKNTESSSPGTDEPVLDECVHIPVSDIVLLAAVLKLPDVPLGLKTRFEAIVVVA
jgi:hypothetical protein